MIVNQVPIIWATKNKKVENKKVNNRQKIK